MLSISLVSQSDVDCQLRYWLPENREVQEQREVFLKSVPSAENLRLYHELVTSEPHPAGSPADQRMIELLADLMIEIGLEVQVHEFWAYIPALDEAKISIVNDDITLDLPLQEKTLEEDPYTSHPNLNIGWNAYSGSGEVTGEVVYANYARMEDFARLEELGIDCTGKIIIARYGRLYRGYKVKFAEEAGAAGLIIYTDPQDSGYGRGIPYPEGGWANETSIQRGSVKTLTYIGDPLTPFVEATEHAERLDPDEVELPRIPVQPIGWQAAQQILSRMTGKSVQQCGKDWQGGLPLPYRITGGDELIVQMKVKQTRRITKCANVLGILEGTVATEEKIIIGCHFDAWTFGAGDPHSGTMLVLEAARSFTQAARAGFSPKRTIVFAHWGAEEMGIIGSTEFCEANGPDLRDNAVAYLNLDMAAMGARAWASAAPLLKQIMIDTSRDVPQAHQESEHTIYDTWTERQKEPSIGSLGGGSDSVGFYFHVGVPSCSLGAGGSRGVSYHSNYDTLHWYRQVVGDDYEPAVMLTQWTNIIVDRLANADLLPLDPLKYATDSRSALQALEQRAATLGLEVDFAQLTDHIDAYEMEAQSAMETLFAAVENNTISPETLELINTLLRSLENSWIDYRGLPERPWFRNYYAATDPAHGYGTWHLPGLRWAIEQQSGPLVQEAMQDYLAIFESLRSKIQILENLTLNLDDLLKGRQ